MDPNVKYPVVQGEDNAYYLHRGFNRGYNINGCIFMSSNNSPDWTDPNTIVYGHNMRNGSMFGTNSKYMSKKYIKKHPYFYIYTEDGRYIYEIFNTMTVQDASDAYEYFFETEDDFSDYLEKIQKNSSGRVPAAGTQHGSGDADRLRQYGRRGVFRGYVRGRRGQHHNGAELWRIYRYIGAKRF